MCDGELPRNRDQVPSWLEVYKMLGHGKQHWLWLHWHHLRLAHLCDCTSLLRRCLLLLLLNMFALQFTVLVESYVNFLPHVDVELETIFKLPCQRRGWLVASLSNRLSLGGHSLAMSHFFITWGDWICARVKAELKVRGRWRPVLDSPLRWGLHRL